MCCQLRRRMSRIALVRPCRPCRRFLVLAPVSIVQSLETPIPVHHQRAEIVRPVSRKASLETALVSLCLLLSIIHVSQGQNRELFRNASFVADALPATATLLGTVVDENDA